MKTKLDIRTLLQTTKRKNKSKKSVNSFDQGLIGLGIKYNFKTVSK